MLRLVRNADQLLRRTHLDAEGVRSRLQEVDTECEKFMNKIDSRRKNITMAVSFFDMSETVSADWYYFEHPSAFVYDQQYDLILSCEINVCHESNFIAVLPE